MLFNDISLNDTDIPSSVLNIDGKTRSNLLPWNGQFSPQLVEALLKCYASPKSVVLDPFAGSGTVMHECGLNGLSVFGADINPAAYILSKVYTLMGATTEERQWALREVEQRLLPCVQSGTNLFGGSRYDSLRESLIQLAGSSKGNEQTLLNALIVLSDFSRVSFDDQHLAKIWAKIADIVRSMPSVTCSVTALHCDARSLPLPDNSIDLVVTSPPYINVYNYHQYYRKSAEALGWDLLQVAKSEIGANRKHRGNRFMTVVQYCLDIAASLQELLRVCRPNARIIFVVGRESKVRGVPFFNGDLVARLAVAYLGCRALPRQERVFTNRFGQAIYEDLLHFSMDSETCDISKTVKTSPREIAVTALREALTQSPKCRRQEIEAAIASAEFVHPSPVLDALTVSKPGACNAFKEGQTSGLPHAAS